jgi:hypothetical protein
MSAIVRRRNTPKTAILARDTPQIIAEVAAMSFLVERYGGLRRSHLDQQGRGSVCLIGDLCP